MDIKLGECKSEGKREEHITKSAEATRQFLNSFDIDDGKKRKIINCVATHHGNTPFECKEAEICANSDCYKFLSPIAMFKYTRILSNEGKSLEEVLKQLEFKMDEKWNILSLDICKEELVGYYNAMKKLIAEAKKP